MAQQYDLVIIGTGTAAQVAAMRVRAKGWTVAVIDFRPFGGTCALRGCDPKKALVGGSEPIKLGIPGEEHLATHEDFLTLQELPHRVVLVGGGYIAAEFSHIAARAGANVTILQRSDRILPRFDPDLVGCLMEAFSALGIE